MPLTPDLIPSQLTSPRGQAMLGYNAPHRWASRLMAAIFQYAGSELDQLRGAYDNFLNEAFATLATWTLPTVWEPEVGLTPDTTLTTAQREQRVVALLQGLGLTTTAVIRTLCSGFGLDAHVVEDAPNNQVSVVVNWPYGQPANYLALQAAVQAICPARLQINWRWRYTLYAEIKAANITYGYLKSLGLTYGQIKTWPPYTGLSLIGTNALDTALTGCMPGQSVNPPAPTTYLSTALTGSQQQ